MKNNWFIGLQRILKGLGRDIFRNPLLVSDIIIFRTKITLGTVKNGTSAFKETRILTVTVPFKTTEEQEKQCVRLVILCM